MRWFLIYTWVRADIAQPFPVFPQAPMSASITFSFPPCFLCYFSPIATHTRQTTYRTPHAVGQPSRNPSASLQGISPSLVSGCTSPLLSPLPPPRMPCSLRPQISQEGPSPPAHRTVLLLLPDSGRCRGEACSYATSVCHTDENSASLLGILLIMSEVKSQWPPSWNLHGVDFLPLSFPVSTSQSLWPMGSSAGLDLPCAAHTQHPGRSWSTVLS